MVSPAPRIPRRNVGGGCRARLRQPAGGLELFLLPRRRADDVPACGAPVARALLRRSSDVGLRNPKPCSPVSPASRARRPKPAASALAELVNRARPRAGKRGPVPVGGLAK